MLKLIEQLAASTRGVVKVDMLVPGRYEEPQGSGRELYGGDGVGWGVRELELCCKVSVWVSRA